MNDSTTASSVLSVVVAFTIHSPFAAADVMTISNPKFYFLFLFAVIYPRTLQQLLPSFFHSSPRQQMAEIYYSDPVVQLEKVAPDFEAPAIVEDAVTKIKLSHYRGRWVVLLFYPKDFTFVCPTEIIAFNDRMAEFEKLETRVLAISTDTEEVHLAWWV